MSKKVFYLYNPETASYERVYPSMRQRLLIIVRHLIVGILIGVIILIGVYYWFDLPKEKLLRQENAELKSQYKTLNKKLDMSLLVLNDIQDRDDNFYRVLMQAEPLSITERNAGLDNIARFSQLSSLTDAELVISAAKKLDNVQRKLYAQINSFDEIKEYALNQKDRIKHIPSIQPIADDNLKKMASGYGYRTDPIYGTKRFHAGMDFASDIGTDIYATGDGVVEEAGWASGYGNNVVINHGYNYRTRYAHMNEINVTQGKTVIRGEKIGEVGNTGKSTGPHLHYEVLLNDKPQNPVNYYFQDLTPSEYSKMIEVAENAGHVMD